MGVSERVATCRYGLLERDDQLYGIEREQRLLLECQRAVSEDDFLCPRQCSVCVGCDATAYGPCGEIG